MPLPIIATPKYELTIPSTKAKVEYRPYLVKEEKILIIALESKDGKEMIRAVRDVISACTFGKINVEDLRLYDLEYIFIQLRAVSVGATSEIKISCSECSTQNETIINLDKVEVNNFDSTEKKIDINGDVGMVMKTPTVKATLRNTVDSTDGYDAIIGGIISCIDTIYDNENTYSAADSTKQELIDFVESLNQEQFNRVSAFFEDLPSLVYNAEFDCKSCGKHNVKEISGFQNFF